MTTSLATVFVLVFILILSIVISIVNQQLWVEGSENLKKFGGLDVKFARFSIGWWKKVVSSSPRVLATTTTVGLIVATVYILYGTNSKTFGVFDLMQRYIGNGPGSRFRSGGRRTREHRFAMKNGGEVGGIANEGNTCFMNSVIQSLASSRELGSFIEGYLHQEIEVGTGSDEKVMVRSSVPKVGLEFTKALKDLMDGVNGSYGTKGKEFSTRDLLANMPNGPKQNFFSGYNQEDAQEFYQLVFNLLEREYKLSKKNDESKEDSEKSEKEESPVDSSFVDRDEIDKFVCGFNDIGYIGPIYVPAEQVDPNLVGQVGSENKYQPLQLVTPVDGVTVERVGCLTCGEIGGIRYSVNSGLSLNLPNKNAYAYDIEELLEEWISPDIIEDVNCNRCGLSQTLEFLEEKISGSTGKVATMYETRAQDIKNELESPIISDEVFDRMTIKQMIKKTKKSKQILMSRPPPLLSMHINRSVFDPRTYQIVKNTCNVSFPEKLDLSKYSADPENINMDARLPLKKEGPVEEKEEEEEGEDEQDEVVDSRLVYDLKAVISHYGTHNYGHYICYRKQRGTWWRISDESVYVVNEEEVVNSQGTFMLFYEYNNGSVEDLQELSESEEEEEEEEIGNEANNDSSDDSSTKEVDESDTEEILAGKEDEDSSEDFNTEEGRAFHI
ncbi:ubiquitin carboxyl-terminal hydrolase 1 [[Candida] anglica]